MKKNLITGVCLLSAFACVSQANAITAETSYVCTNDAIKQDNRPAPDKRLFHSDAVEKQIERVCRLLTNTKLAWMFTNCFPNTLDTTVHFRHFEDGRPDTFYPCHVVARLRRSSVALCAVGKRRCCTERNDSRCYQPPVDVYQY